MIYNTFMNNPEKTKNLEWLGDEDERNRRLGQLGLSKSQKYSELSQEEKQFLDMDYTERRMIEYSYSLFHRNKDLSTRDYNDNKRSYINTFISWYNLLSSVIISPDKQYTQQLNLALTDSVLNLNISDDNIRKIVLMMSEVDTPNFAKQMAVFKIQHPINKLSDEFRDPDSKLSLSTGFGTDGRQIQSPILRKTIFDDHKLEGKYGRYGTEEVIYRDIIKCAFNSGGKNIEQFLDKLSNGNFMMRAIMRWPDSNELISRYYSQKDLNSFQTLIRQLHSMHYQTKRGEEEEYDSSLHNKYYDYGKRTITEVKTEIQTIYDEYRLDERDDLGDKVVQSFCYPLGIKSVSEAYDYIQDARMNSFFRHRQLMENGQVGRIRKGDLIKSVVNADYLPFLLENGVISKEYLGVGEASDCTPLDTDVSMILEEPLGLRNAISKTSAAVFSAMGESDNNDNVFLIFRNDERFEKYDDDVTSFDEDKYEICGYGGGSVIKNKDADEFEHPEEYWYMDDRGIRTGIPSSEIDYIATDEKSVEKVIESVKESRLFIPVTNLDGIMIFDPFKL
ncbi:hypothetical protein IJG12_01280 [Candidatus Saccharibacteria bacterium]|nr:hypothetical protein [Candidatus Saccharibacteria bacterium]